MPEVVTIATPELGDRSYVLHDGREALVVDPQRDVERVLSAASLAGVRLACVAETHVHNDYVTGGLELARAAGCDYLLARGEHLGFEHRPVGDGDQLAIGAMTVRVLATPGHTDGHLAYVVAGGGGVPEVVCTGGSMLFGTVGRTDLLGAHRAEELSREQYRSVRRLAAELADTTLVLPTHGFGSFCSSSPGSGVEASTIGDQRRENIAVLREDEDRFVADLAAGLTRYPAYYAEMAPINRAGPPPLPARPVELLDPAELGAHLASGGWVVDLRDRREFAAAHLAGSVGFEHSQPFTTYLGWLVPSGARLVMVGDTPEQIDRAALDLARIGRDGPYGASSGGRAELSRSSGVPLSSYEVTDFVGLAAALSSPSERGRAVADPAVGDQAVGDQAVPTPGAGAPAALAADPFVLDVRRSDEWAAGHIPGSSNVFLADLIGEIASLPRRRTYVHCASGYRAAVAAGILQRAGREVVLVDDDWSNAEAAGLSIERPGEL